MHTFLTYNADFSILFGWYQSSVQSKQNHRKIRHHTTHYYHIIKARTGHLDYPMSIKVNKNLSSYNTQQSMRKSVHAVRGRLIFLERMFAMCPKSAKSHRFLFTKTKRNNCSIFGDSARSSGLDDDISFARKIFARWFRGLKNRYACLFFTCIPAIPK